MADPIEPVPEVTAEITLDMGAVGPSELVPEPEQDNEE